MTKMIRWFVSLVFLFLLSGCQWYGYIFQPNVHINPDQPYLEIATGSDFRHVMNILEKKKCLHSVQGFEWMAKRLNYDQDIRPGRYKLVNGMTNIDLIKLLKSGRQTPVKFSFHYVITVEHLAGKMAGKLEPDSATLVKAFYNEQNLLNYKKNQNDIGTLFIPNTYEFFWNTTPEEIISKLASEYHSFWNEKRLNKSEQLGLTPSEVSILASIVQSEQKQKKEEWPVIAGLYINRLKKGMPLQSDPTVIFAHKDFSIRRVLKKHLNFISPYNTYLNSGLPPGPILLPEPDAIDAVLNYADHDYLFMCASDDFSGYHKFAISLSEHTKNAIKYRKALTKRGILQ